MWQLILTGVVYKRRRNTNKDWEQLYIHKNLAFPALRSWLYQIEAV